MTATTTNPETTTTTTDTVAASGADTVTGGAGDTVTGGADTAAGGQGQDTAQGGQGDKKPPRPSLLDDPTLKGDDTATGGDDTAAGGDKDKPAIEYKDFALPEDMPAPEQLMGDFKQWAAQSGLTQEQAQAALDLYVRGQQGQMDQWQAIQDGWRDMTVNDPEIGGKNLRATVQASNTVVAKFFPPEFVEILTMMGLGNNPHFIRGMVNIHRATANDTIGEPSGGGGGEKKPPEKVLYPGMK